MPRYRTEQLDVALTECKGMVYVAAARLGCSPNTIKKRLAEVPSLAERLECARGLVGDGAELKLYEAIEAGDPWAIQFYLKTAGRDRGYVERSEHEHSGAGGGPLRIVFETVDDRPAADD